jgi:hypothetical protein
MKSSTWRLIWDIVGSALLAAALYGLYMLMSYWLPESTGKELRVFAPINSVIIAIAVRRSRANKKHTFWENLGVFIGGVMVILLYVELVKWFRPGMLSCSDPDTVTIAPGSIVPVQDDV